MDMSITLTLDSDGFLRRECPNCRQQFKWHHGPANAEAEQMPDPDLYFCPLCGEPAPDGEWWTADQLDYMERLAAPAILSELQDELARALGTSKLMKVSVATDVGDGPPAMPVEPDDMWIVTSPCHSYEPVKVPERVAPAHSLPRLRAAVLGRTAQPFHDGGREFV